MSDYIEDVIKKFETYDKNDSFVNNEPILIDTITSLLDVLSTMERTVERLESRIKGLESENDSSYYD